MGGNNYGSSGPVDAGTGVLTQTGGSVGSLIGVGNNNAVGLVMGGNWSPHPWYSPYDTTGSGTFTLGAANGVGSPLFVGGVEAIGVSGTATFTQNCGTNAIVGGGTYAGKPGNAVDYNSSMGALVLGWYSGYQTAPSHGYDGDAMGTYNLNGGLLTGGGTSSNFNLTYGLEIVGLAGTGIFTQTAGINNANGGLYVGGQNSSRIRSIFTRAYNSAYGTYTLSGGSLNAAAGGEYIGTGGTGIFTQTAGTNIAGGMFLAGQATKCSSAFRTTSLKTPGTYNLNGGLLQAASFGLGPNGTSVNATFNFTAGTLQASSTGLDNSAHHSRY